MNKLRNFLEKIIRFLFPSLKYNSRTLRYLIYKKSIDDSLDFVSKELKFCEPFENRDNLIKWIFEKINQNGLILECGVHRGHSLNFISKLTNETVYGFDSFEGLPDDGYIPKINYGGIKWYAGKMGTNGLLPEVSNNVKLVKGWFDKTLPSFFKNNREKISFVHIDCDIYSSTKTVLNSIRNNLSQGTIILFDEYLNYEGWQKNEYRALMEFQKKYKIKFEYIGYSYFGSVAIKILK